MTKTSTTNRRFTFEELFEPRRSPGEAAKSTVTETDPPKLLLSDPNVAWEYCGDEGFLVVQQEKREQEFRNLKKALVGSSRLSGEQKIRIGRARSVQTVEKIIGESK